MNIYRQKWSLCISILSMLVFSFNARAIHLTPGKQRTASYIFLTVWIISTYTTGKGYNLCVRLGIWAHNIYIVSAMLYFTNRSHWPKPVTADSWSSEPRLSCDLGLCFCFISPARATGRQEGIWWEWDFQPHWEADSAEVALSYHWETSSHNHSCPPIPSQHAHALTSSLPPPTARPWLPVEALIVQQPLCQNNSNRLSVYYLQPFTMGDTRQALQDLQNASSSLTSQVVIGNY